ncbi:MAG: pantoate--beta-alanine ligase [Acidimicrobiales bacterium]|nr:pantoate--beta-alanine ligase [Acidimicrobiales bacterium]
MRVISTVSEFQSALDQARLSKTVGLVPTMGYLHDGHASLIVRAHSENDFVAVTVFVNPLQFGVSEDFSTYPRDLDRDVELARQAGADVVFAPTINEMYPDYPEALPTKVSVSKLSEVLDGKSRPGHFDGVATVVAKLFAMAGRVSAYFGEKDFQQLAIINQMAADLSFPVKVIGCKTVRETDGLAASSRNVRLSEDDRQAALILYKALQLGKGLIESGENNSITVARAMESLIKCEARAELDYATCVDPKTLLVPDVIRNDVQLLVAAKFSNVRLIDNVKANFSEPNTRAGSGFQNNNVVKADSLRLERG